MNTKLPSLEILKNVVKDLVPPKEIVTTPTTPPVVETPAPPKQEETPAKTG